MSELRKLPRVDTIADSDGLSAFSRPIRVQAARSAVALARKAAIAGKALTQADVEMMAISEARAIETPSLRPAINMSGVVLHTGLGRARLAPSVARLVQVVANSHSNLELDLESGERGDRQEHVRSLLCEFTGAEDALVVNNAAAGVVLALSALAAGRGVILSRGQMVEIGGAFRLPEIVRQSGCVLAEVGCTNKTRLADYKNALNEETAAILRCHPSNFKIVGFTEEPSLRELVSLAREHDILCIDDMGSGCLVDTSRFGLPKQPTLREAVGSGAHLVIASGDKLLGGPQAGLVLGSRKAIDQLAKHPLARAFRIDKLSLTALEGTLSLYKAGRELEIPCLSYLARTAAEIKRSAVALAKAYPGGNVRETLTEVGGGCAPGIGVPSYSAVMPADNADELAAKLRASSPPIISRVQESAVWLDPRTAERDEVARVVQVLKAL